jgi:hypothetical protein
MMAEPPALSPPAPGAAPVTQRFKVVSDGLSATISLEAKWLAKPFAQAVVQTVVLKLNKRPNVEPVAVESLEGIEIDGEQVALPGASVPTPICARSEHQIALRSSYAEPRLRHHPRNTRAAAA